MAYVNKSRFGYFECFNKTDVIVSDEDRVENKNYFILRYFSTNRFRNTCGYYLARTSNVCSGNTNSNIYTTDPPTLSNYTHTRSLPTLHPHPSRTPTHPHTF